MSERSRNLPRRSVHIVPGSNERFLQKASSLNADAYVLDLEDSVAPGEKAIARERVLGALLNNGWGTGTVVSVRINSGWAREDLENLVLAAGTRIDAVVLPKVEREEDIMSLALLLSELEQQGGLPVGSIGIEVMIESAAGLIAVDAILRSSERIETAIFGPLDFAASIGIPSLAIGQKPPLVVEEALSGIRTRLLVSARAVGCLVIDGPYFSLDDDEGLRREARASADLGLDGKWSIHPSQIAILNEAFTPTQESFDRAHALLERYGEVTEHEAKGAVRYEGAMIDEATRKLALSLVRRGEQAGLSPSKD